MLSGPELEGKYEVLRKIREGGMGAVYEVRHRLLDERRVIKVLHPHLMASQELAERFRREARTASGLRHPNLAHLHDFSVDPEGRAYIIMELIEGLGLDEILRAQGPPPLGLGLEICCQALRAIGFLHRRGFLHRDVSPDNLMLTRDSEGAPLVKLIDLGIAKVLVESGREITLDGTFIGKPRYASPEQLGTGDTIDGRSDLYSLGIVIYELLTGACPIQGTTPSSLLASQLFQPPLDFTVSDPEGRLPPDLREILLKALAKKPEERFASAEEMRARLAEIEERVPWTAEDLDAVLVPPQDLDATAVLPRRRGSTQDRLDRELAQQEAPEAAVPVPVAPPAPSPSPPVPKPSGRERKGLGRAAAVTAVLAFIVVAAALVLRRDNAAPPPSIEVAAPVPAPLPEKTPPPPPSPVPEATPQVRPKTETKPKTDPKRSASPAPSVTVRMPEGRRSVRPPVPVSVPIAKYPKDAAGSGARGQVVVSILVNERGEVAEAKASSIIMVQEGLQTPDDLNVKALFREAAVAAARRARFAPATSSGVPVTFRGELAFDF